MSPWLFNGRSNEGVENGDGEEASEISRGGKRVEIGWPLVCDDLVLCGESEEDLRAIVGLFIVQEKRYESQCR